MLAVLAGYGTTEKLCIFCKYFSLFHSLFWPLRIKHVWFCHVTQDPCYPILVHHLKSASMQEDENPIQSVTKKNFSRLGTLCLADNKLSGPQLAGYDTVQVPQRQWVNQVQQLFAIKQQYWHDIGSPWSWMCFGSHSSYTKLTLWKLCSVMFSCLNT